MQPNTKLKIQVLVDNNNSWIIPFARNLVSIFLDMGHDAKFLQEHNEVEKGDVLFLLGCTKIFKELHLNKHNLVVHESDLPKGKGWSPLTWQIIEGKNEISITLFEAVKEVDAGPIYLQDKLIYKGDELVNELREKQGLKTIAICKKFVKNQCHLVPKSQKGDDTFYKKRTPKDSELNINKSIKEQFNLLRVVDNERYPAFFFHHNKKYLIKIYKSDETN